MDPSKTDIVIGPPGTGKTTRMIREVESALEGGVRPDKIGFISFTKKGADEGKIRACDKFNMSQNDLPHFRTLHSMAFRYLGMRRDQVFGWPHIKEIGQKLGLEFKGRSQVEDGETYGMATADRMLFFEGLAKNTEKPLHKIWNDAGEDDIDWSELERFAATMTMYKKSRGLLDFNDMLVNFVKADSNNLPKFDLLIIDEAQDLSALQWRAVRMLSANAGRVIIAGDDLQAIYKWSGADVDTFIGLKGTVDVLDQSYRIPSSIQTLAKGLEARVTNKRDRGWKSREETGAVNWLDTFEDVDLSKGSWLLLARNGYMLEAMEDWCMSQGFSYHSVNRDPLKSPALMAVKTWENLRRGKEETSSSVQEMFKYMGERFINQPLVKGVRNTDKSKTFSLADLKALGLGTEAIWHEALTRISPRERDFFIAARRRGEPLLKEPRIKISTIHAAKGGEADHVMLLTDMSYRCYSNMEKDMDDETRVWYVAATRSRETLNLVMPQTDLNFSL